MKCKALNSVYHWWPLKGPIDVTVTNRLLDDDGVDLSLAILKSCPELLYSSAFR